MRRRSHVLVLVIGAAAALLCSAPALGAAWLLGRSSTALGGAGTIQQSPAIATIPGRPTLAAVVADDGTGAWRNTRPQRPPPAAPGRAVGWSVPGSFPHSGSTSAGQADIAWGIDAGTDRNVYAVDIGSSGR